jgi:predicted dehydrogenase
VNAKWDQPLVLVVGTGSIGRRHINNLRVLKPGVRFVFVRAQARQDALSNELSAEVVPDLATGLKLDPALAIVANPSDQHAAFILPLLRAGVPTYIEKPVVIREEDAAALARMAPASLPTTQVGCNLRFLSSLRQLKTWIAEGALGRIVRASLEVGQWLPDWRPSQDYRRSYSASVEQGGGVVFDLVHEIDLAHWLFGDLQLVAALGARRSGLEIATEDVATMMMLGADGEHVTVQLDYVSRMLVRRIHVVGDEASAFWDLPGRMLELRRPGEATQQHTDGFDMPRTYVDAMREFIDAAASGATTSLPLPCALPATRMSIRVNHSIRNTSTSTTSV